MGKNRVVAILGGGENCEVIPSVEQSS
jgi:hypothetical protein